MSTKFRHPAKAITEEPDAAKIIKLSDGTTVSWCPCGKPPDGPGHVIKLADGREVLAHYGCVKAA